MDFADPEIDVNFGRGSTVGLPWRDGGGRLRRRRWCSQLYRVAGHLVDYFLLTEIWLFPGGRQWAQKVKPEAEMVTTRLRH